MFIIKNISKKVKDFLELSYILYAEFKKYLLFVYNFTKIRLLFVNINHAVI